MKEKQKPKYNVWQNTCFMIGRAWIENKSVLVFVVVTAMLGVLMNLLELFVIPALLGAVEAAGSSRELLNVILFFSVGFLVVSGAMAYIRQWIVFGRIRIRSDLLKDCVIKTFTMSYPNTENPDCLERKDKAGESMNNDHSATQEIWVTLTELCKNGISFLLWFLLLANLHPFIIGITLVACCADYAVTSHMNDWGYRHRAEEDRYVHELEYLTERSHDPKLAKDLRIFGMGKWLEDVFEKTLKGYGHFKGREERACFWADACSVLFTLLRNGTAYAWLIGQVLRGEMQAVQFVLYFTALGSFTGQIMGIFSALAALHRQSLDISRVRDYLEETECFAFEEGKALSVKQAGSCSIALEDVSFRYEGAEKDTLRHISLQIAAGEKLAVVGLNGVGKTTLIKLICGFYDPTQGSVRLNGEDIRQYNRRDYYRLFSAVFQECFLLPGTVAENISQMVGGGDLQKVISCAGRAGFSGNVQAMPKGYETKLGKQVYPDAIELSGGEMQRLMMARALYKDAPVMVLDEPTAALDPIAENDIYRKYNDLTKGCTSVFISHRLASTRFCDRIILLEDGSIAEEGTHEELMEKRGRYAKLFEVQSRYYKEGMQDGSFQTGMERNKDL